MAWTYQNDSFSDWQYKRNTLFCFLWLLILWNSVLSHRMCNIICGFFSLLGVDKIWASVRGGHPQLFRLLYKRLMGQFFIISDRYVIVASVPLSFWNLTEDPGQNPHPTFCSLPAISWLVFWPLTENKSIIVVYTTITPQFHVSLDGCQRGIYKVPFCMDEEAHGAKINLGIEYLLILLVVVENFLIFWQRKIHLFTQFLYFTYLEPT